MSGSQDAARLIAERVARRLAGEAAAPQHREPPGLNTEAEPTGSRPRARLINFVSSAAPPPTRPSVGTVNAIAPQPAETRTDFVPQIAQSPWLAPFNRAPQNDQGPDAPSAAHPSQERFGVEEAAVSELVEFFENEKQCSVDPSGKPCDHCAMCSSRGF